MEIQKLNETITKTMTRWNIPGAAVAIIQGEEALIQGFGVREAGKSELVDADTIFAIGSTTKAFTSALVGMLVDEGLLKWDVPVIKYLPDFELYDPWVTEQVTVRDLLCHRLGLERAQRLYYHKGYSQRDLMHRMKFLRPAAAFRTQFMYANQQYGVAGLLIEAVTGLSWAEFIRTRLFEVVGMSRSVSGFEHLAGVSNLAAPHAILDETYPAGVRFLGENKPIAWFELSQEPSGSIHTSANDLAAWLRVLLDKGGSLLQPATFSEISTPQIVMQDMLNSELAPLYVLQPATHFWTYALGWWVMDYHGEKVLMHGGQMPGFNSVVAFFPERKMGLALALNVHQTLAHASLFYAISDILLGKEGRDWASEFEMVAQGYMGQVKTEVDQFLATREPSLEPCLALSAYIGTFSNAIFGDLQVTLSDGVLNLVYGKLFAVLEHFKAETFIVHWNLKGLQDDSILNFSPDGNRLTMINDRAEYRRL